MSRQRNKQLVLPVVGKLNNPKIYVPMDGVHVPVVRNDTEGRAGKTEGQRVRTRECKPGCVFLPPRRLLGFCVDFRLGCASCLLNLL